MSYATKPREEDLAENPATKADLELLSSELRSEMVVLRSDLEGKIKDVEGQVKDLRVEMYGMSAALQETMNREHANLRDSIHKQSEEIGKLRVSMAWITVGVTGFLAGLITLFEFLS